METFEKAHSDQLKLINEIYDQCKSSLLKEGVLQWGKWGNNYPCCEYLHDCTKSNELFVLKGDGVITGAFILNEKQSPEWGSIAWKGDTALVLHALAIKPDHQGKGYGRKIMLFCEIFAVEHNYRSIRLDAFSKNIPSYKLYQRLGYEKSGSVFFECKPEGNKEYFCYEKLLSQKR